MAWSFASPATAQQTGGNGGENFTSTNAGGTTDPLTGAASDGADGSATGGAGGGGGAGITGGAGGTGGPGDYAAGTGGAGGAAAVAGVGGNGGDGGNTSGIGVPSGPGGGGGGADGGVVATFPAGSLTGGNGGNGGASYYEGGGGGGGGYGAFVTGTGGVNTATIRGGNGGNGGSITDLSSSVGAGGGGGAGGVGVFFATGGTLVNMGTIAGGNGGIGGLGGTWAGLSSPGADGAGGAGVVGANLTITNSGSISGGLSGDGVTRADAITFTGGANTLTLAGTGGLTGNIGITAAGSTVTFNQGSDVSLANAITGAGGIIQDGSGTLTLTGTNTYTGGTTIAAGRALQIGDGGTAGSIAGDVINNGALSFNRSDNISFSRVISGTGAVTMAGTGTLTLSGTNTYTGVTTINDGTLQVAGGDAISDAGAVVVNTSGTFAVSSSETIGSLAGTGNVVITGSETLTTGGDGTSTTFSGVISENSGTGYLTKIGTGKLILSGINSYTGTTTIDGGTLSVNGSIASSAMTTVDAGGTLGGNGTVGNTTVDGGTLSPGNSIGLLTVQGNLLLTSASTYMVEVSPSNADRVNVTGTATLGGATVNASFASGSYVTKQYTIVNASGGVIGTFGTQVNTNLPASFTSTLSYDANNAYLNLTLDYTAPDPTAPVFHSLNANQQNVGDALVNYFNRAGGIPLVFGALDASGLTQVSGELGSGAQQTTFDAMNMFMGMLTDPFTAARGGGGQGANGYADEALGYATRRRPTDAFAAITRKVPPAAPTFEARWNVWAAGFGGSRNTDGNAGAGSSNATSSIYGTAVGADYKFAPDTVAGFALAGGGSNFYVGNGGSGRSDLFQAGAFVRHTMASAYITAAAAYGWQNITTDRNVIVAGIDRLHAQFNANSYSGRIEAGNRFVLPWMSGIGLTPYAAAQVTAFDLPSYVETANGGTSTFALGYAGKTATNTRSEFGFRSDKSFALDDTLLTLRGRAGWAHDFDTGRSVAATFQTLPGASFVVNGAAQARDAALTTASAEMAWTNGWSVAATFEGEFSDVTQSYAGKGALRYVW